MMQQRQTSDYSVDTHTEIRYYQDMKNTTYKLFGKNHKATVTACERVTNDPDYPAPYWLWTLRFETPIRLLDGSLMFQTFVRRFTRAHGHALWVAA